MGVTQYINTMEVPIIKHQREKRKCAKYATEEERRKASNETKQKWKQRNKDKIKEYNDKYNAEHKEEIKEHMRELYRSRRDIKKKTECIILKSP
jgi:threonine synthase